MMILKEVISTLTNILFAFFLTLVISSCSNHHESEELSREILSTELNEIDELFETNRPMTSYYLDSVLNGNKPSFYFAKSVDYLNRDYEVKVNDGSLNKNYYSYTSTDNDQIRITFFDKKDNFKKVHFDYGLDQDNWFLKYIEILDEKGYNSLE